MTVLSRHAEPFARGAVVPESGPLIGQEFFRIRDQTGFVWYWWISYDLAADWSHEPEQWFDQELRLFFTPYWVKMADEAGDIFYIYPSVDGSPTVRVDKPAIGDGIVDYPALRVRGGRPRYKFSIVGGDIDVVPA